MTLTESPGVSIDVAHANLLYGLVRAHKSQSVLEFGWGNGRSCATIVHALNENGTGLDATYTLVDNWADWGGERPKGTYMAGVTFVNESEKDFTYSCTESFDFIFSDADHTHAQEWFIHTYTCLLNPGGVLCYHDVCNYPNLWEIVEECRRLGLPHVVFDKNSIEGEACQRGILCIFKPVE